MTIMACQRRQSSYYYNKYKVPKGRFKQFQFFTDLITKNNEPKTPNKASKAVTHLV
ncbi:hypothetical protein FHS10_002709 [Mucilaginibacter dorajii]|nr:hypothetical protein [Mucilaginibacter dorajii]